MCRRWVFYGRAYILLSAATHKFTELVPTNWSPAISHINDCVSFLFANTVPVVLSAQKQKELVGRLMVLAYYDSHYYLIILSS